MKNVLCLLLLMSGCANVQLDSVESDAVTKVANGSQGMVATAHPEATKAAVMILEAGGNAADAAVAAGFAIAVAEPSMNSIGGRSQVLLRTPSGEYLAINGMTEIPASYVRPEKPEKNGYGVIATPGVVAALSRLHSEQGSLPWATLLQPAIDLAEDGFVLLPGGAVRHEMGNAAIKENPGFQQNLLVDGESHQAGSVLKQAQLANTLKRIAEGGADEFYKGGIAKKIAEDMAAHDGFVTYDDLGNYRAIDGRYISTTYRDVEVHSIAAPAGGGLVVKALNLLENFDLASMNDLEWAAVVNQALALSVMTMRTDYEESDLNLVADKNWAKITAQQIKVPNIKVIANNMTPLPQIASAKHLIKHDWTGESWGADSHHTTHFVTSDCSGMAVSITQTVGPLFGSKVITPELGFVYASTMGSYLATADQTPGSRPRTTIAPTVVTKNGEVIMVLGAAGGLRILSGIVQTISRHVDQGLTLEQSLAAPRIHPATRIDKATGAPSFELNSFHAELTQDNGWQTQDLFSWQEAGFVVKPNDRVGAFSRVQALGRSPGAWQGAADLDWEGSAAAPRTSMCSGETK